MTVRSILLCVAFAFASATTIPAHAQNSSFAREAISVLKELSVADCFALMSSTRLGQPELGIAEGHLVEGSRLVCESLRLAGEVDRLRGEEVRLTVAADVLDPPTKTRSISISTSSRSGFRSSQLMRHDAGTLASDAARADGDVNQLEREAFRIFSLAVDDAQEADPNKLADVDPAGANSLVQIFVKSVAPPQKPERRPG